MKLLKSFTLSIILMLPLLVVSNTVKADTTVWPTSVSLYQFPGQSDEDWRIVFNIYPSYSPNPDYFRIFGKQFPSNWKEVTDNGQFCRADLVSMTYISGGYEIVYMMGAGRVQFPFCLGQAILDTSEVYMTYP